MKKIMIFCVAMLAIFSAKPLMAQVGTVTKVAGSLTAGYNGEGILDTLAKFNSITCFCKDTAGNIYIADRGNYRIRKIDAATHLVTTIAGNGSYGFTGDGGPGPLAKISGVVYGISVDNAGNVIFGDDNRIRKINTTTGVISTIAGGGSSIADGIPALSAQLYIVTALYRDSVDNIYFGNSNSIRKIDAATGNIYTLAGTVGTSGFTGDGGPATAALIYNASGITIDRNGNLYFVDQFNYRIRKIDASGVISTIAGNGAMEYGGSGGLAINSQINVYPYSGFQASICTDPAGNIYFPDRFIYSGEVLREINRSTGIINKVGEGSGFWAIAGGYYRILHFLRNAGGDILFTDGTQLLKLSNTYTAIKRMSFTDTMLTPPCTMRATKSVGVWGTVNMVPGPTDSVVLETDFGDGTTINTHLPYWATTDTSGTVYGFGYNNSWITHTYVLPGNYQPRTIVRIGDYKDAVFHAPVHAASVCDSGIEIVGGSAFDSITTSPCVLPANVRTIISGLATGIITPLDSAYLKIYNGDGTIDIVVVPIDSSGGFTYVQNHPYGVLYNDPWLGFLGSPYNHTYFDAFSNNGLSSWSLNADGMNPIFVDDCTYNWGGLAVQVIPVAGSSCAATVPYATVMSFVVNELHGSAAGLSSVPIRIDFGDGMDTSLTVSTSTNGTGGFTMNIPPIYHTYTIPGVYTASAHFDTTVVQYNQAEIFGMVDFVDLPTSCSPLTGTFYIDANSNCTPDAGETRLAHWPFLVVNNTTGDTTNAWADYNGNYHISMTDTNSYTIIANHASYYDSGSTGYTLAVACPITGLFSATASAGTSYTQDFGFTCTGTTGTVDMSVSGWGWGFVPGDTGIISIWSSDAWGYTCSTLSSTITLTIDSNLSYIGMWNGPAPTTVSGNVLTWTFATASNLFDFSANVKVLCDTTAMMGDTARNVLYVSPTSLADTNLTNNTYAWSEPIRSSWDPNEKEVSPKGFGAEGYIPNGTPLSYIVHFQNSGTASATTIKVFDTISANLDLSTLQIISSSAPVLTYQMGSNAVQFRFNNINLPDSTSDPEGSKGYVAFNILPKDNLAAGTVIENKAGIYFDYNPAIFTNTTINTIEDSTRMITGADHVCAGSSITLANGLAGGVWAATNANATVANGMVTGVIAGIDTIVYTVYGDKSTYKIVNVLPGSASGTLTGLRGVCVAATTTLTAATPAGTWSSSSVNATVTDGVVTGVSAGGVVISYSFTGSCGSSVDTFEMMVNALPDAGSIIAAATVCAGATTTLSNTITGGTWSSSSADATVSGGVVSGVAAGSATISYSVTNGCGVAVATMPMTVNPLPDAGSIIGAATVCAGATTTLSNTITGGTWSSGSTSATVTGGVVSGVTAGSSIISYSVTNGCGVAVATMPVTVNPLPDAGSIIGAATVCAGATTTLSNIVTGGVWSSSSADATVSGGVVSGVAAGSATISYSVINGCGVAVATMPVTINLLPDAGSITGTATVCAGATTTLSNTITGGTWSSSSTSATVTGGLVSGLTAGAVTISYTVTNSCGTATDTMMVTVNPLPNAGTITGAALVCAAGTTTLSSTVSGGVWSTGSSSATVSGGVVSGISAGTALISYGVTNGCGTATDTILVTVATIPDAGSIVGVGPLCVSGSLPLTSTSPGGVWSTSGGIISVSGTGVVTPVSAGTGTVIYTLTNACGADTVMSAITVTGLPTAGTISGDDSVCEGALITLTGSVSGGMWSSTNSSVASISSSGNITGLVAGTVVISYAVTNSCGSASVGQTVTVLSTADCNTGVVTTAPGQSMISIYPNPTNGSFIVEIPQPGNDAVITITDISGKVVEIIKSNNHELQIPVYLTNLASGTYLIKVEADGKVYRDKVVLW
ncbi:hypothetical protein CJD36_010145 [Flavipsychrobacter stenotrophus]|uniref:Uncharacterized protein n=1 Tax=Flavipsychrobacter stenotrophus TaxID=2077091 RepID=A0A2S7SZU5_9BACT|nr:T9SS type A sorting domain-containing protein [Flavipsychrobacter stenotrophus]PQJ12137.1 hypothetical protein CJD36_010145 [Flavipsychrobacter stenotrophus]